MHSVAAAKEWRAKRPRGGIASAGDARDVSCSTPEPVSSNRPTAAATAAPPAFAPAASGTPLQGSIPSNRVFCKVHTSDSDLAGYLNASLNDITAKRRLIVLNDGSTYEGPCNLEGKFHGRGKLLFICGDTYVGEFSNGLKNGNGTYVYSNQSYYNGNWRNGVKHGKGISVYKVFGGNEDYTWFAGDVYDGEFVDNVRHGACEYTWFNGEKLRCVWSNGKCPEWSQKTAEIFASMDRSASTDKPVADKPVAPAAPAVKAEQPSPSSQASASPPPAQQSPSASSQSSTSPPTSPPPARRPPGIYNRSPPPSPKRSAPRTPTRPASERAPSKAARAVDANGWYVPHRSHFIVDFVISFC
jgi:hypothetical protein